MLPMACRHRARTARAYVFGAVVAVASLGAMASVASAATQGQPSQAVLATCAACHGKSGNSTDPATPKIAGQKPSYLSAQLKAFRSGARKSDTMAAIASTLSDAQIAALSRYFGRERVRPDHVDDTRLAALGKRIYFSGGRGVPACAACHGPQSGHGMGMMMGGMGHMGMGGMGMMRNAADAPNLAGQHAAYVVQQLDAFAKGTRRATVMDAIASRLGRSERKAVAAYVAGLR